jgi:hypothetical protein
MCTGFIYFVYLEIKKQRDTETHRDTQRDRPRNEIAPLKEEHGEKVYVFEETHSFPRLMQFCASKPKTSFDAELRRRSLMSKKQAVATPRIAGSKNTTNASANDGLVSFAAGKAFSLDFFLCSVSYGNAT